MRLHSNILRASAVRDALDAEKAAGRIARTVTFKILTEVGSRSHEFAMEVQLSSWDHVPGDGRRRGNDGAYGAMTDSWAATYDEWGWLMAAVYRLDADAVWGTVKRPTYADAGDFHGQTGWTYMLTGLLDVLESGAVDPFPYVYRPRVGRAGAGRAATQQWYGLTYRPRTAAEYRALARL